MRELLERMGWIEETTHGVRAAFKTWTSERTNDAREVVKLCLFHVQGDPLERAHQRGDIIEKRRQQMQAWADYCEHGEPTAASNVEAIKA